MSHATCCALGRAVHLPLSPWDGCRLSAEPRVVETLIGITSDYVPRQRITPPDGRALRLCPRRRGQRGRARCPATIQDEQVLQAYLDQLDGLVLIGRGRYPPEVYGEQAHETVKPLAPQRYEFERGLIAAGLRAASPCSAYAWACSSPRGRRRDDDPGHPLRDRKTVDHRKYHRRDDCQAQSLGRYSRAEDAKVLSSHHQAVDVLGKDLSVIARSEDGVAEAMERTVGGFGLFVQWHPEAMADRAHRDAIYGALVRACSRPAQSR